VITFIFIKGVTQDMNTFKRKALFTAVVAGLGAAGTAEAVYLSPNNMGQVLVYPYYTTQAIGGTAFNTFISVVNTTTRAKAVKVRVLEGKTSAEVLDFNLFLSANDVWVAAIVPIDAASNAAGARLLVPADERSCTNPAIPAGGVDFRQFQYATGDASLPGTGLDRTREGYIEILEMGPLSGTWSTAVTHNSAGIPNNCGVVQVTTAPPSMGNPSGGLTGTGTLINVNSGLDAGYKADALDAWSNVSRFSPPDSITPNLASAAPASSLVFSTGSIDPATGSSSIITIYRTDFGLLASSGVTTGARAVASVYMHSAVINEYILDTNTLSNTDWVITQPLKNLFVTSTTAATPYSNVLTASGACELVGFSFFNRDERGAAAGGTDFSPIPPGAAANTLCWESNVLSIRNPGAAHTTSPTTQSLVLGSFNLTNVNVTSGFQNGWATLSFVGAGASGTGMFGALATSDRAVVNNTLAVTDFAITANVAVTFFGLPVTGFMVRTFRNNTPLPCAAGSTATCANAYSSLFQHSYRTVTGL